MRGAKTGGEIRLDRGDSQVKEFLAMGDYGFYVWGSYIIALIIFVSHFISSGSCMNKVKSSIKRKLRRQNTL